MPSRFSALPIIAVMLVVAGAAGIGGAASAASATPATPRTVQATFEFTELTPGVEKSVLEPFTMSSAATITSVQSITPDGLHTAPDFTWTGELCNASGDGCRPFDESLTGTTLSSGEHTVRVGVTMTGWGTSTSSTALAGLVFAGADSAALPLGLAATGLPVLWSAAVAATVLAGGVLMLAVAQRRRVHSGGAASVTEAVTGDRP